MLVVHLKNQSRKMQMFITMQTTSKRRDNQSRLKPLRNKNKNTQTVPEFIPDCMYSKCN